MLIFKLKKQLRFWSTIPCHFLSLKLRTIKGITVIPLFAVKVTFLSSGIQNDIPELLRHFNLTGFSICKCVIDFHFCRSPFGARQAALSPPQTKKEPDKQHKSAACQAQCRLHHLSNGIMVVQPFLQNEISPPCIMLKQTCDLVPV